MKRIEDERIIAEKRKINSNSFGICFLALWGILLYRQYVLQQGIVEYLDIFILTIGLSIYITINSVVKGLYLTYRSKPVRKKVNLIGAFAGSIAFTLVQFFAMDYDLANLEDMLTLLGSVIIFFMAWMICQSILLNISEAKANKDVDDD
ncbi:MAG: DUF6773 family protein [Dethiobacteria bacterium]|jgi:drug/metabolite transporter (DMT)-like permease